MSEIENLTEKVDRLTSSVDKLSELVEKVAIMLVKQDAQEKELDSAQKALQENTKKIHRLQIDNAKLIESKQNDYERISSLENSFNGFIKWLLGIAGTLIAAGIIGMIALYGKVS